MKTIDERRQVRAEIARRKKSKTTPPKFEVLQHGKNLLTVTLFNGSLNPSIENAKHSITQNFPYLPLNIEVRRIE